MEWYDNEYQECVIWAKQEDGGFEMDMENLSGVTHNMDLASSDTAVRLTDIKRDFDSGVRQMADDEKDYKGAAMATHDAAIEEILSMTRNLASGSASSSGAPTQAPLALVDAAGKDESQDSDGSDNLGMGDSGDDEDMLHRLTGMAAPSKGKAAPKANSSGSKGHDQAEQPHRSELRAAHYSTTEISIASSLGANSDKGGNL